MSMKSSEQVIVLAATLSLDGVVTLCRGVNDQIQNADNPADAQKYVELSRILDAIGDWRFQSAWDRVSPARMHDRLVLGLEQYVQRPN